MRPSRTLLEPDDLYRRLAARDPGLFPLGAAATGRLSFQDAPRAMERAARDLERLADSVDEDAVTVVGVGVAPLMTIALAGARDAAGGGGRRITVCDAAEARALEPLALEESFVVVLAAGASRVREGELLFDEVLRRVRDPRQIAVVAPEKSALFAKASARGVRRALAQPADAGDRFGALGVAGALPAALAGYDVAELCGRVIDVDGPAAVALGLELAAMAEGGQHVVGLPLADKDAGLGPLVSALFAGALGGDGGGLVALVSPTTKDTTLLAPDALSRALVLDTPHRLGELVRSIELAVIAAAHTLALDPFDDEEPNWRAIAATRCETAAPPPVTDTTAECAAFLDEHASDEAVLSVAVDLPGDSARAAEVEEHLSAGRRGLFLAAGGDRARHAFGALRSAGPVAGNITLVPRRPPATDALSASHDAASAAEHELLVRSGRPTCRVALDALEELWA